MSRLSARFTDWIHYVGQVLSLTSVLFVGAAVGGMVMSAFLGGRSFFELILATTTPALGGIGFLLTCLVLPSVVGYGEMTKAAGWSAQVVYLGWMGFVFLLVVGNPSGLMTSLVYDPTLVWRNWWAWLVVFLVGRVWIVRLTRGRVGGDAGLVE